MAAHKNIETLVLIALIALLALWQGTLAQSDCGNAIIGMSSCLNYITGNTSSTSSACCSQLATVMLSQPQCLSQALNGGASSLGVNVNQTQALALPDACNVKTPSASRCNGQYYTKIQSPSYPYVAYKTRVTCSNKYNIC